MLVYVQDSAAQTAQARFGTVERSATVNYPMPATAPTPRTAYEAAAILRLANAGAQIPALVVPVSARRTVTQELGTYAGGPNQLTLEGQPFYPHRPMIVVDPESEAFIFASDARARFQEEKPAVPEAMGLLLESGLRANPDRNRLETGAAWDKVRTEYGFGGIAEWYERVEAEAKACVFLAPSPVIRSSTSSVTRALDYGWQIVDNLETAFDAVGVQLPIHSEVFADDAPSVETRLAIVDALTKLYRERRPRNFPVIAFKIVDLSKSLSTGPQASVRRRNLCELLCQSAEAVHRAEGLFVAQNFGTWSLGPLDCGADVVGFRGTGRTLEVDTIHPSRDFPARRGKGRAGRPSEQSPTPKRLRIYPFDPVKLADTTLSSIRALWKTSHAFPVADHVDPEPFWTWDKYAQRAFRTLQVTSSLLSLGAELRSAARGAIPLRDCVRDRVERMQEHDAMFDLCPSL